MDPIPETKLSEALFKGSRALPKNDRPVGELPLSWKTELEAA
jgi:hypothetical protein